MWLALKKRRSPGSDKSRWRFLNQWGNFDVGLTYCTVTVTLVFSHWTEVIYRRRLLQESFSWRHNTVVSSFRDDTTLCCHAASSRMPWNTAAARHTALWRIWQRLNHPRDGISTWGNPKICSCLAEVSGFWCFRELRLIQRIFMLHLRLFFMYCPTCGCGPG
jgi:hypothetical protein